MRDVLREMGKVYRQARLGSLDMGDARGLIWMLDLIRRGLESGDLEKRIEALEQQRGGVV